MRTPSGPAVPLLHRSCHYSLYRGDERVGALSTCHPLGPVGGGIEGGAGERERWGRRCGMETKWTVGGKWREAGRVERTEITWKKEQGVTVGEEEILSTISWGG